MAEVPSIRIRVGNGASIRSSGRYVVYWMVASRRLRYNFALDRALELARALGKPIVVFEALRCGYRWASDRLHRFVLDGMAENARECDARGILYYPYVEPDAGAGAGLLFALASDACAVITDDYPCFFLPAMLAAAAKRVPVRFEAVDSNGLLPLRAAPTAFPTAHGFRRFLQKTLPAHLAEFPSADPLAKWKSSPRPALPAKVTSRWPSASNAILSGSQRELAALPIDRRVAPVRARGGSAAARAQLRTFLDSRLSGFAEQRNDPAAEGASGLSPYLHFGHISSHEVFAKLARREKWKPENQTLRPTGSREAWWNMSASAEAFLDELVTWREVGYNLCANRMDYDRFESLPDWARKTLQKHARDERSPVYTLKEFESAATHDPLWNAAQTQLLQEGRIQNYLRMLWGKKILEWSSSPREAVETMIHLNNKYAVDGRDPNSYSGIFWCLGRYDRPWGPERPIFGTVRYMSSQNTARKFSVKKYLETYSGAE